MQTGWVRFFKVCGISLDVSSMEDTIRKTEEAMRGSSKFENGVQVFLESWRDAEDYLRPPTRDSRRWISVDDHQVFVQ